MTMLGRVAARTYARQTASGVGLGSGSAKSGGVGRVAMRARFSSSAAGAPEVSTTITKLHIHRSEFILI